MTGSSRITFVLPGRGLFGGIRVVAEYGNLLLARGHEVTIVCLRSPRPRRPGALLKRVYQDALVSGGIRRDHLHGFRGSLRTARVEDLARVVPEGDAVIATHWLTAKAVDALSPAAGTKFYFLQHYEAHSFDQTQVDATWRLPMQKLVVAGWLGDLARERFGDPDAIHVPNGIDASRFDAPPRGLHHPPTVGLMYSPAAWKGCAVAFDAIRLVREEIPELQVVCFGAKPPSEETPLPTGTRFRLRPPQAELREVYASADVWLMASQAEGFGLPPLEAMACRCPVVVTRCGGPEDFVVEAENGYFVEVGDAEGMARRVVQLLRDEDRWRRLSDAAYTVRSRFSLERAFARFEGALLGAVTAGAQR